MKDTSVKYTVQNTKGMVKDPDPTLIGKEVLTHHVNGMFQTVKGNIQFAVTEPATLKCIDLPYNYIGAVALKNNTFLTFSGNGSDSEMGISDLENCTYTKIANNPCFKFSNLYPITGFVRINSEGEQEVIFVDGVNYDRILNLDSLPYTYTIDPDTSCKVKIFTDKIDCDAIRLNPNISLACLEIKKGNRGNLPDGVYSVAIAYAIDGQRFSDYFGLTTPIMVNNKSGDSSLTVNLSGLDRNFKDYQLLLIGTVEGITTRKLVGTYPSSQTTISISDWINDEYQDGIPGSELTVSRKVYDQTGLLAANSQYLMRADVKQRPKLNYQQQAFNIRAEYVVIQKPLSYYLEEGEDISYWRDENYNFVLRWYYPNGEKSEHFQIANQKPNSAALSIAIGEDVFEIDKANKDCDRPDIIYNWMVYNTASNMIPVQNDFVCNSRMIGYGVMGYNESTDKYPDNTEVFGDSACTGLRNFRMPDEQKVERYTVIDGEIYINILGVRFSDIEHPLDDKGNPVEVSGYEILRSERDSSNKTVISRGILTNMGGYTDKKGKNTLYSNFPQNSLEPNQYLSSTQTFKKGGGEKKFTPLTTFYPDKFTYYTPYGNYFGRQKVGGYFQVETEESGTAKGYFEEVYQHPKHKLLTNFSLFFSLVAGIIEAYLVTNGKKTITKNYSTRDSGGTSLGSQQIGQPSTSGDVFAAQSITTVDDIHAPFTPSKNLTPKEKRDRIKVRILKFFIKVPAFLFSAAVFAANSLKIIFNFSDYTQFAYQYNSEVLYTRQRSVKKGKRRRMVLRQPFYMDNGIYSVGDFKVNNGGRNSAIFVEFQKPVDFPIEVDNTRRTLSGFGICDNKDQKVESNSSVLYATNKIANPNQYGTIEGVKPVKIHNCVIPVILKINNNIPDTYKTDTLFGGDCIIYEETHLNKFPIFRQNLANANYENGIPYDYRLYNNIGFARYWYDSTEYNMGNLINIFGKTRPSMAKLPNQKFNLDCKGNSKDKLAWSVQNQYMYLSVNGVFRYIAEADYNIAYRDNKQEGEGTNIYSTHYSKEQNDLSFIFRSDMARKQESFQLDPSYKFLSQTNLYSNQLVELPKGPIREKNSISYSLPATSNQSFNNWRYFLPNNYFSFDEKDFGTLTGIHAMDKDRVIFLFSKTSPFISLGRDQLETVNGRNVTIGDGGLFAQMPREVAHTDVAYGSNHDSRAFISTQFGPYYVSRKQGKIFGFDNNLNEISREGLHSWCAEFMPINLLEAFPDFKHFDNTLAGVGYQLIFDNLYETIYICKKDYFPKKQNIEYDKVKDEFTYNGYPVKLTDDAFFEDCSFTLSYNPPSKSFQSFHDWHPDAVIQQERHFVTVKNNTLWKHNERSDLFCNYYGKDYPYVLEVSITSGLETHILQSVEYIQEAFNYRDGSLNKYHNYTETFDRAQVYNSEQYSGMLHLEDATNTRYKHLDYPEIIYPTSIKIPMIKEENTWHFNMFYDYTKDRGRFTTNKLSMFLNSRNGYERKINIPNLDLSIQRPPRFRHHENSVWLSKTVVGANQLITKFDSLKIINSPR